MRFFLIGDKDTVLAFSLLGIDGVVTSSKVDTLRALNQAVRCDEIGIVLITEKLAEEIQETIKEILTKKRCHLILQIASIYGPLQRRCSLEDFVHSALGVKV